MRKIIQRYASMTHKPIAAAVNGLYRFEHEDEARTLLNGFRTRYVISSQQDENDPDALILWIKNFAVTEQQEKDGFLGHFAHLHIVEVENGLVSVQATKLETELAYHPRRQRQKTAMPNWGHPVLRAVKRGKHYPLLEMAQAELLQLQLEYPETSVPGDNKLYLMVFSRQDDPKNPVKKYVLEIKNQQGGGFIIEWKQNERAPVKPPPSREDTPDILPQGHFTSLVALKRKRKPRG